jgi:hypothetical protein
MCPFCLASLALAAAGLASTGGLAALAVKVSAKRKERTEHKPDFGERSSYDGNHQNGKSESSLAR